jgi:hypothetical protein
VAVEGAVGADASGDVAAAGMVPAPMVAVSCPWSSQAMLKAATNRVASKRAGRVIDDREREDRGRNKGNTP